MDSTPLPAALWMSGDVACADGDLAALGAIADELAVHAQEPLHCELQALVEQCRTAPAQAVDTWFRLKARVFSTAAAPGR